MGDKSRHHIPKNHGPKIQYLAIFRIVLPNSGISVDGD